MGHGFFQCFGFISVGNRYTIDVSHITANIYHLNDVGNTPCHVEIMRINFMYISANTGVNKISKNALVQ